MVAKRVDGSRSTTRGESTRACGTVDGCWARAGKVAAMTKTPAARDAIRFIKPQIHYRPESVQPEQRSIQIVIEHEGTSFVLSEWNRQPAPVAQPSNQANQLNAQ